VAKHAALPTTRSRRRGAPKSPQSDPGVAPSPPRAPRGLTRAQAAARRALWAEPVARYWAPADDAFVVRLVRLREMLDEQGTEAPLGAYAAVLALERVLYLTPAARRERLKLAVAEPPPTPSSNGRSSTSSSSSSSRRLSARERERLLRG
jgi:hypothetical protein